MVRHRARRKVSTVETFDVTAMKKACAAQQTAALQRELNFFCEERDGPHRGREAPFEGRTQPVAAGGRMSLAATQNPIVGGMSARPVVLDLRRPRGIVHPNARAPVWATAFPP
jgi:hypothetical protein